jgi:hypothetical protein
MVCPGCAMPVSLAEPIGVGGTATSWPTGDYTR